MNPHQTYKSSITELFAGLWRNRQLILQLTRREVAGRYRGSFMGLAWSVFNPLFMLLVYTFVFTVAFKARWGGSADTSGLHFAFMLFAGLIVFGLFAECLGRAPGLILAHANYVRKVVFPLEILPWVALGSALFHALISMGVLLVAQVALQRHLPWTCIYFPLLWLPLMLGTLGCVWFLASLGVFVRDVGQLVGVFTAALMFLSPVFYPLTVMPERARFWLSLNPLAFIIEQSRGVLIEGAAPDWGGWLVATGVGLLGAWLGFWWFQKTRRGFADVL
jgi:lipopolysaccharide transport system permease protein